MISVKQTIKYMNKNINKLGTSNTPTKRLKHKEIYDDIYLLVQDQVDEMLQRGGTYEFNWSNATNYTDDILGYGPTNGWLVSLYCEDEDQFAEYMYNWVGNGITQDVADQMIANYPRYLSIYWKNYKKIVMFF